MHGMLFLRNNCKWKETENNVESISPSKTRKPHKMQPKSESWKDGSTKDKGGKSKGKHKALDTTCNQTQDQYGMRGIGLQTNGKPVVPVSGNNNSGDKEKQGRNTEKWPSKDEDKGCGEWIVGSCLSMKGLSVINRQRNWLQIKRSGQY